MATPPTGLEWQHSPLPGAEEEAAAAAREPWFVSDKENVDPRAAWRAGGAGGAPPGGNGGAGWKTPSDKDALRRLAPPPGAGRGVARSQGGAPQTQTTFEGRTPTALLLRAPGAAPPSGRSAASGGSAAPSVRTPMMDITPEFVRPDEDDEMRDVPSEAAPASGFAQLSSGGFFGPPEARRHALRRKQQQAQGQWQRGHAQQQRQAEAAHLSLRSMR